MLDGLKTAIDNAPYSTDQSKQRQIILATYLNYLNEHDNFKIRAVVTTDSDGNDLFMLYATDSDWEHYLWADLYEGENVVHSSLEDCLLEEILYSSDDTPYLVFEVYKAVDKRGEFRNVIDNLEKYI